MTETRELIASNGYLLANSDLSGILLDLFEEGASIHLLAEIQERMTHQMEIRRVSGFEMTREAE